MEILPAIDLRDGKVVRLAQGDYGRQTTYSGDPARSRGISRRRSAPRGSHVVDLDAAKSGVATNTQAVKAICGVVKAKVELGGGVRDDRAVERMLEMGAARIVIGSAALKNWAWFESLLSRPGLAGNSPWAWTQRTAYWPPTAGPT